MSKTGYIYKLVSTDIEIKECYVGSTKNERVRKTQHKSQCNNPNSTKYNIYIYQFIRENGGFDNFDMVRIEEFKYDDKKELHARERYWIEQLQAKLNTHIPTRTIQEWYIDNSEIVIEKKMNYYQNNKKKNRRYTDKILSR